MESAEGEGADDEIDVVGGIYVEVAVVNAAAVNGAVARDGDDAIAIFDNVREGSNFAGVGREDQALEKAGIKSRRNGDREKRKRCNADGARSRPLEFAALVKEDCAAGDYCGYAELQRNLLQPEVIHPDKSDRQTAES